MINVINVKKEYHGVPVLNGLDIQINKGELIGILGPIGSGKTTLFQLLLGNSSPTSGQIKYENGLPSIGYQSNTQQLPPMKVGEYLFQIAANSGLTRKQCKNSIAQALSQVGLTDSRKKSIMALSKGKQQRVAIASALIGNPALLLLDQPFDEIDQLDEMKAIIKTLHQQERTILIASDKIDELTALCNRLIILSHGKICYDNSANGSQIPAPVTQYRFNRNITAEQWIKTHIPNAIIEDNKLQLPVNRNENTNYILIQLLQDGYQLLRSEYIGDSVENIYQKAIQP